MSNYIKCILDSNRGVYIPNHFVTEFDLTKFEGIDKEDEIACGLMDSEDYWDAWARILDNAKHTDDDGIEWTLHQDGDLFLIAVDRLSDSEYVDFYGESRV